jgi:hypothetical protein
VAASLGEPSAKGIDTDDETTPGFRRSADTIREMADLPPTDATDDALLGLLRENARASTA